MQIPISWLLQKPTDLDLHCLQRQGISRFSKTRIKMPHPLLISSQSNHLIQAHDTNLHTVLTCNDKQCRYRSPTDLDLLCKGRAYSSTAGPALKSITHVPGNQVIRCKKNHLPCRNNRMKIVFKHTDAHPALVTALYANVKSMHKNMPSVELSKVNI